jgi:hypothetical protein
MIVRVDAGQGFNITWLNMEILYLNKICSKVLYPLKAMSFLSDISFSAVDFLFAPNILLPQITPRVIFLY